MSEGPRSRRASAIGLPIILAALALRLPALAAPLGIDQGIYATAAWQLQRGLTMYRQVWDHKPPGIHLTYLGWLSLTGHRVDAVVWLDLLAGACCVALLVRLGSRLGGARLGWTAGAIYAVATIPAARYGLGGFLERAVPETFICLFAVAAALAADAWRRQPSARRAAVFGSIVGLAIVFKPTAVLYWPALLAWLAIESRRAGRAWNELARLAWTSAIGVAVAPLAAAAWLAAAGALPDAMVALGAYNRAYLSTGPGALAFADLLAHDLWRRVKTDPLWLIGALAGPVALRAWIVGGRESTAGALGLCWLAAATLAAAANGFRLYTTYFMPTLVPLALLAAWLPTGPLFSHAPRRRAALIVLFALAVGVAHRGGYFVRGWQATAADLSALAGRTPRIADLERYGGYANGRGYSARANAELTEYLRSAATPDDAVYIFGMQPGVYFTSERRPASRYIWTGPVLFNLLTHPDFQLPAVIRELEATPARLIVLERNYRDSQLGVRVESAFESPAMQRLLDRYDKVAEVEDFVVFRRRDGSHDR